MTERIYFSDDKSVYMDALYIEKYEGLPKRKAMVVFPGGGYSNLAPHESEIVAAKYFADDFNVFTLYYTVDPNNAPIDTLLVNGVPKPIVEASLAIAHIRKNADKYGVDPDKICIMGFSAGGHLAASLATMWQREEIADAAGIKVGDSKPNAALLCYAAMADGYVCTEACLAHFMKDLETEEQKEAFYDKYIPTRNVTNNVPPIFIFHTFGDKTVVPENAHVMSEKLFALGIPHELIIYPDGQHGISVCENTDEKFMVYNRDWVRKSIRFLDYILGEN